MYAGINQKTAPIRFFFLIQPENKDRFKRAMELAWSVWGGVFAPIFAYYDELPVAYRHEFRVHISTENYYKNSVENYDPDVVLFDGDLPEETIKALVGEREIKTVESYLDDLKNAQYDHALTLLEIAEHFIEHEFKYLRSDDLLLSLPKIDSENILLKTLIGDIPTLLRNSVERLYQGNDAFEQPDLDWDGMETYPDQPKVDVMELNSYKLRSWATKPYKLGSAIYFMRSDRLQDIINFWNLRAAGWKVVPLAVDLVDKPYFKGFVGRFTDWAVHTGGGQMGSIRLLIGYNLHPSMIDAAWAVVKPDDTPTLNSSSFSYQYWFPRFWAPYEYQDADHIKSELPFYDAFYDHYDVENGGVEYKAQELPFEAKWNLAREAAYKIVMDLSVHDDFADYAELLTGITNRQLRQLAAPVDFRHWRLSAAGIHRTVNRSDDRIRLSLPNALEFFKCYFANTGHRLAETSNSKLAKEVLKNIGGMRFGKFLLRAGPLKIIELFEGGKEISYVQLIAEIKKTLYIKKVDDAKAFISRLLEHKIIEMGAKIQCGVCDQHGFFLPVSIAEKMTCPICRNQFNLPMADPTAIAWTYRGIGPFSRGNKADGVMAVFATLSLFQTEFAGTSGKMSALFGFELNKTKPTDQPPKEVDLCVLLQNGRDEYKQPDLLFCECKTYKRFTEKDIERMKVLGDEFPGALLAMATLNERLDDDEVRHLTTLVRYFQRGRNDRPANPILILTGTELLPEDYYASFKAYKSKIKPYHKYNDYIGALAEFSVKEHLKITNWWDIREQQRQDHFFVRQTISNIIVSLQVRVKPSVAEKPTPQ